MHVKYANIFIIYIGDSKPGKVYLHRNVYIMNCVQITFPNINTKQPSDLNRSTRSADSSQIVHFCISNQFGIIDSNTVLHSRDLLFC